jgi:hypothetical protein
VFAAIPVCFLLVSIAFSVEDNITARDGSFVAYENGVVKDSKTGLEWIAGPDRDITWEEARTWAEQLKVDGGGWRMPSKEELKTLYQKGAGTSNLTPLLKTTGQFVWSKETKEESLAWATSFFFSDENWFVRDSAHFTRGFAVRSSK